MDFDRLQMDDTVGWFAGCDVKLDERILVLFFIVYVGIVTKDHMATLH
ncbi:MAG: hypothetical protein ACYC6W_02720 [Nitrosotalea sp.]